jgi:hypothetical protein
MARTGDRRPFLWQSAKGEEAFHKLSKADFADIAATFAVRLAGEELDADQIANKIMAEHQIQLQHRKNQERK